MKTETYIQDSPLVTAVITTHNRFDLVIKAIHSVQSQTYSNLEIIVVDDAPEEEVKATLSKLAKEENFRYIYIDKTDSKGGNHARNIGIQEGEGKYIAFLDDDDEWLPEKIQKQISSLQEHPGCQICYCGSIRDYNYGESQIEGDTESLLDGDLSREIFVKWQCVTSQMIVDWDLLFEIGLFDEALRFWQEYELCMRLFQKTKVCVVRENLVLYRVIKSDKQRLTNQVDGWEEAVAYIYNKHKDEIEKLSTKDERRRNYFWYRDGASRCEACGNKRRERWGALILILMVFMYSYLFVKLIRLKRIDLALMGLFFVILGFGETYMYNIFYNITMLCILGVSSKTISNSSDNSKIKHNISIQGQT